MDPQRQGNLLGEMLRAKGLQETPTTDPENQTHAEDMEFEIVCGARREKIDSRTVLQIGASGMMVANCDARAYPDAVQ